MPELVLDSTTVVLVLVSFLGSFISVSVGIGGGTLVLATMAQVLPVAAIVPVHGVVQFGSNIGRAAVLWRDVDREKVLWFTVGAAVGAIIGGNVVVNLPLDTLRLLLAVFILYIVWGPMPSFAGHSKKTLVAGGALTTVLTMFVGATGPFTMSLLRVFRLDKVTLVATFSTCMTVQHVLKIAAFGVLGFAFAPYLPLIALMIVAGFLGTLAGRRVLLSSNVVLFNRLLNLVLTGLALKLAWDAVA